MSLDQKYLLGFAVIVFAVALLLLISRCMAGKPTDTFEYKTLSSGVLVLDAFRPPSPAPPGGYTSIVFFHGGGWTAGARQQFYPQCNFLSQEGIYCLSAEYRVSSIHGTSPIDAVEDANDAFNWLVANAETLGLNPDRISAGGGSSGGHLAAMLGVRRSASGTPLRRPHSLVLYNPMINLEPGRPDHELVKSNWESLSPHHLLDPELPDTLLMVGDQDEELPVATASEFCEKAQSLGAYCSLAVYPGADHGFFNPQIFEGRYHHETNAMVLSFIRERN